MTTELLFSITVLILTLGCIWSCPFSSSFHTLCIYRSRACPGKTLIGSNRLTIYHKRQIVGEHNRLRALVARGQERGLPAATNMLVMTWDEELERIAQRWAEQCVHEHDRNRNVGRFQVGQNIAYTRTYGHGDVLADNPDWPTQIKSWYREYYRFGFNRRNISPFKFKSGTGHFTQVIWGSTNKVGCGYTYYKAPSHGYTKLYVCNYGPRGNMIGDTMYEVASKARCTRLDLRFSFEFPGLCETDRESYTPLMWARKRSKNRS
ncbi:venom allergen 3-like [Tachypleus tridentatus]|uniref:venom allergen 3-like n=1 Tax=Tachypleus tridentatus TaxID=6853 RepID=UPI003FCF2DB9